MATRRTIHVLKNNQTNNGSLPTTGVQMGEPLVNLYNGILFFSGTTGGNFTPSNLNSTYFEVGSNLYDLAIRNKIVQYQGQTNLSGKFLSGTTTGFVLVDIASSFSQFDTYVTGFTYSPNTLTISRNQGQPDLTVTLNQFNNINLYGTTTVNGLLTVTGNTSLQGVTATNVNASNLYASSNITGNTGTINTINSTTSNSTTSNVNNLFVTGTEVVNNLTATGNTSLQGVTATNVNLNNLYASNNITGNTGTINTFNSTTSNLGNSFVTGTEIVNNLTITGTGVYNTAATGSNPLEIVNFSSLSGYVETNDTYVTGGTVSVPATNNSKTVTVGLTYKNSDNISRTLTVENTFTTGGTYSNSTKNIVFTKNDATQYTVDLSNIDVNDTYVTGGTNTSATSNTNSASISLKYNRDVVDGTYTLPYTDSYTTGGTLNSNVLSFTRNDGVNYTIDLNTLAPTGTTALDKYVTGFTYNNNNVITVSQNQGLVNLTVDISTLGTITVNGNATVTGVTTTGNLISNNGVGTQATIGQGGLVVGSGGSTNTPGVGNLTVHGNLVVFGTGTTIATNELYVEDPQITLNYNPTGSTAITSIASGIKIQNGNGLSSGNTDVYLTIARMDTFTGGAVTEYTGSTGYANRAFLTQLNDIVIRNTNLNNGAPDGVRVLAEFDILDGGIY